MKEWHELLIKKVHLRGFEHDERFEVWLWCSKVANGKILAIFYDAVDARGFATTKAIQMNLQIIEGKWEKEKQQCY